MLLTRVRIICAAMAVAGFARVDMGLAYDERYRPQFHFTTAKNWTNDPNGLVYFEGEYHLFYQYNPFGDQWGHMSWGHAVSDDMVHWKELDVAIPEEGGVMAFSGSAVVDWDNTSGWGKDGKPPLVAVYTGHRPADGHQFQRVAYSNDRGRTWTRFGTVIDIGARDFRDPKVFWYAPKNQWSMVVSLPPQHRIRIYHSTNLRDWTLDSEFGPAGCVEGAWECPDLFPLKVEGGGTKWVMTMSVSGGAPAGGSGVQYIVGEFDGERFVADVQKTGWVDHGPDCYAAVTWSDLPADDGRRVMLGWMTNLRYAGAMPTKPWRGGMTLPRELSLVKGAEGYELVQRPVRELERLRGEHWAVRPGKTSDVNEQLHAMSRAGGPGEIDVEFDPADAERFGIDVCVGGDGRRTRIGYDMEHGEVFADRTQSGDVGFNKDFPTVSRAKVPVRDGRVRLKVWVDASSVEVFADGGRVAITQLVYPPDGARDASVWSEGGEANVVGLEGWGMKSIWPGRP